LIGSEFFCPRSQLFYNQPQVWRSAPNRYRRCSILGPAIIFLSHREPTDVRVA